MSSSKLIMQNTIKTYGGTEIQHHMSFISTLHVGKRVRITRWEGKSAGPHSWFRPVCDQYKKSSTGNRGRLASLTQTLCCLSFSFQQSVWENYSTLFYLSDVQCRRDREGGWGWGGRQYKLPGPVGSKGGAGPDHVAYVAVSLGSIIIVHCTNQPFQIKPKSLCD